MAPNTYLYFPGCKITPLLPQYDTATRAVLRAFDVRLDHTELNCCGYPMRHQHLAASVVAAARNLAIADREGLPLLTPCQCCYGNLKQAAYWLGENAALRDFVNGQLKAEGLRWHPNIPVRHLLSVLANDIGLPAIRARVSRPLSGLRVAAHYGCHALRPGHVVQLFPQWSVPGDDQNYRPTVNVARYPRKGRQQVVETLIVDEPSQRKENHGIGGDLQRLPPRLQGGFRRG